MLNTVHYTLRTVSSTEGLVNAEVTYDVFYDRARGIAYEVQLKAPVEETMVLQTVWHARILNDTGGIRREYDELQRIYYQTCQTMEVESALFKLGEDLRKIFLSEQVVMVEPLVIGGNSYPGYQLDTLTIWVDSQRYLPVRRENRDRGNLIIDEFVYHSVNEPLPEEAFQLPKPQEAVADFNLCAEMPTLSRFGEVCTAGPLKYGIYPELLLSEIRRHIVLNQWEYGPFATIKLPWLTDMAVQFYLRRTEEVFPPIVVVVEPPEQEPVFFFITYDFLGYVVTGFSPDPFDLSGYQRLPINATLRLEELIPLYAEPSLEKNFVVDNFFRSVQSNDFFINRFDMGGKLFELLIKNFSFSENEGYLLLNVYGKEYWDNANLESMFNFVVTGRMVDAHTTPIMIYALNTMKRLGIPREILMPQYEEVPGGEDVARVE
mgnify:FL=1